MRGETFEQLGPNLKTQFSKRNLGPLRATLAQAKPGRDGDVRPPPRPAPRRCTCFSFIGASARVGRAAPTAVRGGNSIRKKGVCKGRNPCHIQSMDGQGEPILPSTPPPAARLNEGGRHSYDEPHATCSPAMPWLEAAGRWANLHVGVGRD